MWDYWLISISIHSNALMIIVLIIDPFCVVAVHTLLKHLIPIEVSFDVPLLLLLYYYYLLLLIVVVSQFTLQGKTVKGSNKWIFFSEIKIIFY